MSNFEVVDDGVVWRGDGETLYIQGWGSGSFRVRARMMGELLDPDWALLRREATPVETEVTGDTAVVKNGKITARIESRSYFSEQLGYHVNRCSVSYLDGAGNVLLRELDEGGSLQLIARKYEARAGDCFKISAAFEGPSAERIFGMGQYQQEIFDLKGSQLELAHRNSQASVPFFLSDNGYGFLWHNPAIGTATFGTNRTEFVANASKQIDYWITAGDTPSEISANYMDAVGRAPTMPEYGLGYWQCKLRYYNQEQLLEVAREHKKQGIPLDVIVADFFHWPKMGDFRFESEFWPDPKAMVDELKDMGVELMVSVWPQVDFRSENYEEFKQNNILARADRGLDIQMGYQGNSAFVDVTNPRARERLWELCKQNYYDLGVRLFWLDEAEPEYGLYDYDNFRYYAGANEEVGNIYPQEYARAFFEGQTAEKQESIVNLVRCVWAGSARYGALAWSGDISSTFTDLRAQIIAGLHMGISGIPWFTTDIGGFHKGDITDEKFVELLIRWFQFGAFCPVMRMHGDRLPYEEIIDVSGVRRQRSGGPSEVWSFGAETQEILEKYIDIRERLRPYMRKTMDQARDSGLPVMRAMFFEFPDDDAAWDLNDQYMLGDDLLVAPVVNQGESSRSVYLPAGMTWKCLNDGQEYEGGQTIDAAAPLHTIPVFTRAGGWTDIAI